MYGPSDSRLCGCFQDADVPMYGYGYTLPLIPFPWYLDLQSSWIDKGPNYLMILALGPFNLSRKQEEFGNKREYNVDKKSVNDTGPTERKG